MSQWTYDTEKIKTIASWLYWHTMEVKFNWTFTYVAHVV